MSLLRAQVTRRTFGQRALSAVIMAASGTLTAACSSSLLGGPPPEPGPRGTLHDARRSHTAVLLPTAQVLAAGGTGTNGLLASAELYDHATDTWRLAPPMRVPRSGHAALLLPTGKLLVAGGEGTAPATEAEIYDPLTGAWSLAGAPELGRAGAVAVLLPNAQVLLVGGDTPSGLVTARLYDPRSGKWAPARPPPPLRLPVVAALLADASVLVIGSSVAQPTTTGGGTTVGVPEAAEAARYRSNTDDWAPAGTLPFDDFVATTQTSLPNADVIAGSGHYQGQPAVAHFHFDDRGRPAWLAYPLPDPPRRRFSLALLPSGAVLAAGGIASDPVSPASPTAEAPSAVSTVQVQSSATLLIEERPSGFHWQSTGSLTAPRAGMTLTMLPTGSILATGGSDSAGPLNTSERYDPASGRWLASAP